MDLALQLMVGFSVGMAVLLAAVLAGGHRRLELPWQSRLAGLVMLAGLAATQLGHLEFATAAEASPTRRYVVVVFLQSLGFYWLLLGVLRPEGGWRRIEWALAVAMLALALAIPLSWAVPVALALGAAAAAHLCVLVYRLRALRRWFALELKVLGLFGLMAVAVAASGLLARAGMGWYGYAWTYAALIALGFLLVGWLLLSVPDLVPKTREAVAVAYAQSTLARVDRDAMAARLRQLFEQEQIHRSESLSLATVAGMLGLSTHQLSELVNTEFGLGFPRFVRQHRVETARQMLIEEPRASVLSVGMAAGFNSQSSFYVAFKEQVGEVPGEYRRRRLAAAEPSG
ncbi:helix-turn-helix domain-containing protein [Luteimonas sp. RD2P54]|uniref:Helix-turn-helix domain-containing protein n=1 Tax=Luteimonas endophytica TaxID=3042023 RepID=A0ABT6JA00_9GAMM|nr:helix-turn-helix domain-containing protein [Luteimonas endophytica]MDH5823649.1 helix-turn-helix domain-containing protein [Luteimonas endophytica]